MANERRYTDAEYIEAAKMIEDHLNRLKIRTHGAGGPLDGPELSLYGRFTVALISDMNSHPGDALSAEEYVESFDLALTKLQRDVRRAAEAHGIASGAFHPLRVLEIGLFNLKLQSKLGAKKEGE